MIIFFFLFSIDKGSWMWSLNIWIFYSLKFCCCFFCIFVLYYCFILIKTIFCKWQVTPFRIVELLLLIVLNKELKSVKYTQNLNKNTNNHMLIHYGEGAHAHYLWINKPTLIPKQYLTRPVLQGRNFLWRRGQLPDPDLIPLQIKFSSFKNIVKN